MKRTTAIAWIQWITVIPGCILSWYYVTPQTHVLFVISFILCLTAAVTGIWNMVLSYRGDEHVWRFTRTKKAKKDDNTPYQRDVSGDYET